MHLCMLEATFIHSMDLTLHRQKEFVHSLILFQHRNITGISLTMVGGNDTNGTRSWAPLLQTIGAKTAVTESTKGRSESD